jgi:hypothetical protein
MGQLPHVFNDEIVTYPARSASDKMVTNCELSLHFGGWLGSFHSFGIQYQIQVVKLGREHGASAEKRALAPMTGRRAGGRR